MRKTKRSYLKAKMFLSGCRQNTKRTMSFRHPNESKNGEVPAQVSVITREQIERSGSTSLGEILRQIPNLHVMRVSNGGYMDASHVVAVNKYYFWWTALNATPFSNLTPDPMAFFAVTDIERIEFVARTWLNYVRCQCL